MKITGFYFLIPFTMKTTDTTNNKKITKFLTSVSERDNKAYDNRLYEFVALDALESYDPLSYLHDVCTYGCIVGTVNRLIYIWDIGEFFNNYYDEIEEIRWDLQDSGIDVIVPEHTDLRTFLSWIAYEEIACQLYDEICNNTIK